MSWTDDYGSKLVVHNENPDCAKYGCSIHAPTNHKMVAFKRLYRMDRALMERVCPHGVGHPDPDDIAFKSRVMGSQFAATDAIHGCDGCCR